MSDISGHIYYLLSNYKIYDFGSWGINVFQWWILCIIRHHIKCGEYFYFVDTNKEPAKEMDGSGKFYWFNIKLRGQVSFFWLVTLFGMSITSIDEILIFTGGIFYLALSHLP